MAYKTPAEIVQAVTSLGRAKSALPLPKLLLLGFLAGAYIALGGLLAEVVVGGAPSIKADFPGLAKLIFGGVFPVGLMLVVIAGSELFTGNTALMIPSTLLGQTSGLALVRNWLWSFVGNFIGSVFVAYGLVYLTGLLSVEPWLSYAKGIAENKVHQGFLALLMKGVGCNWLVCLAVWLAIAAEDIAGKALAIWWPIMVFVALGFEHSVANMFFVPMGIFLGANVTWGQFLIVNLLPVTLGNIIGGALFVGMFYTYLYGRRTP
ncbi:MAG: formate/nitrite transporter family protein [Phycisphaerae bacterium]